MGEVVVGVDESEGAAQALRWAVDEAQLHGWTVTAVLAWGFLDQHQTIVGERFDPTYDEGDADAALASLVVAAVGEDRAAAVERRAVCDLPAQALLDASADAELLVVGARGLGGFKGLLLGSVSQHCLHHTRIPIAIVRGEHDTARDAAVVVGVDGSAAAEQALAWAVEEARLRGASLRAVNAWHMPLVGAYPYGTIGIDPDVFERSAHELVASALASVDTSALAAPPEPVVRNGGAAAVILEAGKGAGLVVMGSRGLGGFAGLLLGSVTLQVAHYAASTVVVIPTRR